MIFSKLDLRSGYHQLSLARESRYITTFATHEGLRRYKRLNCGTNSASEIFQHVISEKIREVPGAINISDDIIIFEIRRQEHEHDRALHEVLRQLADSGLTISPEKCELHKDSLTFFGLVFSANGVSPDPLKVKAIHDAHTKGQHNLSDFLSRHPSPEVSHKDEQSAERYVNFITTHSTPKAMSLEEIKEATKSDATLQKLAKIIQTNKWAEVKDTSDTRDVNVTELKLYSRVRGELTVNETADIIQKGTRIVIPSN